MNRILSLLFASLWITGVADAQSTEREITFGSHYLNFPVAKTADLATMRVWIDGKELREFTIRLSRDKPDYWVFLDVSSWKGKKANLTINQAGRDLSSIYQADVVAGQDSMYQEVRRPQFHFTPRRGWNNDPNGLVYYAGEYHLFFQHNPYDVLWGNMHWGHAVSSDLIHWKELPEALYPDELGTMFSGSGTVDLNNTAGLQKGAEKTIVLFYTAAGGTSELSKGKAFSQCIAYSNDKGKTWEKFSGNPVLPNVAPDNRDPKVFWYAPANRWILVVYENEGNTIYSSANLKEWQRESHVSGFFECPDMFELPVDGNSANTRWVMYGAAGTYMIGSFDGKTFVPESSKKMYTTGELYAAQTYNNIPVADGRRIQIGWGRIVPLNMPFGQMMLFPTELTLKSTKDGIRMVSNPIREIELIRKSEDKFENLSVGEASVKMAAYSPDEALRIKTTLSFNDFAPIEIKLEGNSIFNYDANFSLINSIPYFGEDPQRMALDLEILVDRTSVEVFVDHGRYSYSISRKKASKKEGISFNGSQGLTIPSLVVQRLNSIWGAN